jgi:hypothetical protein
VPSASLRIPAGAVYDKRVIAVALCQGAALHYVDGKTGVKDFDVFTFYAAHPEGPFLIGGRRTLTSAHRASVSVRVSRRPIAGDASISWDVRFPSASTPIPSRR